jgi:zinc transport system substrate-binding protein
MRLVPAAAVLTAALAVSACGGGSGAARASDDGSLAVAAGFYPYEFLAERVGGEDVEVTNLTQPGGEPHDLELTPQQVGALSETDLVVYSPGFQPAVDEAVEQQAADRAFDVLSAVELRTAEEGGDGHAEEQHAGEEHAQEGDADGEEEHAEEAPAGADPHVWLDPQRLASIGTALADRLAELDPEGAEGYRSRAQELRTELTALDDEMRAGLETCERRQIVTSHDAFGYLADAYGLEQVAVAGLSPEDEASPQRLAEVAAQAEEDGVTTIFFEELVSPKVAESLAREVGATATVLTPLEGAPETGDYLTAMRENLTTLRTALGCA